MKTSPYFILYILGFQERDFPDAYFQMDWCEINGLFPFSVDSTGLHAITS